VICPQCSSEYREGFTRCADCEVDLIEQPPPAPPEPPDERGEIELVKIYEGGNPALIALVESLLDDGDIDFSTTSEGLQDILAGGRIGGGYNIAIGPVMFYVRREDEADARAILATLDEETPALPAE
jgi:hypothetical protein